MRFSEIKGQELVTGVLKRAVRTGQVPHAMIIEGEKGMGKKELALIYAAALLCDDPLTADNDTEPCGRCHSCIMAESGSHPDIVTVTHEKPGSIGVDEIREQVVNDVFIKPYTGRRKIYIIPEAHLLTPQAQNALLKTLEEPPEYAVMLLLSENRELLLPTLISRSVCLSMRPLRDEEIIRMLREGKGSSDTYDPEAVSFARGNPGKARLLAESADFSEFRDEIRELLCTVRKMSDAGISEAAQKAAKRKEQKKEYLDYLMLWFRDILYLKAGGGEDRLIFPFEVGELEEAAGYYTFERINTIIEAVKDAGSKMDSNVNPEYTYEMLFMKMR